MSDLILKALDNLDNPILILNKGTGKIVYHNSKAKFLLEEIERQGICLKMDLFQEKNILLTIDYPVPLIYFGTCKFLDDENFLISFQEFRKDKPFSGFLFELLEALPVLIFFMKDGKIIYVNRFVETLLGYPREEVIGKSLIKDLICEPDRPKAEAHCKKVMKGLEKKE